MMLSASFPEPK